MLIYIALENSRKHDAGRDIPTVNVVEDLIGTLPAMHANEICLYPLNKVVFEDTFNELVEKIGGKEELGIRTRETNGEWLALWST